MFIKSDFSSCVSPQNASPVIPYLSIACVFAFILSFGLGPGNRLNVFQQSSLQRPSLINSNTIVLSSSSERWRHQHLDHGVVHSDDATRSLHDRWLDQLAELFLHQYGVPFYCGEWWCHFLVNFFFFDECEMWTNWESDSTSIKEINT